MAKHLCILNIRDKKILNPKTIKTLVESLKDGKEDAHIFVGKLFLTVKMVNEKTGEVTERVRSTTDLSKMEMSIYWEEIWQWSATYLGVVIPEPNQQFTLYEENSNS